MPVLRLLQELWDRIASTQAVPPAWVIAASAGVALIAVLAARPWRLARNAITIAHEGGHALVSLLTGRRLDGIRLHSDTSGVTYSWGRATGPGVVLTSAAGYLTPPLLGAGAAWLLAAHHVTAMLGLLLVLLAATFLAIRNAYGALAVFVTGGVILAVSWLASTAVEAAFGYVAAWFLLLGGVRPVIELMAQRHRGSRGRAGVSDADQLARLTGVPGGVWVGLFLIVSVAALILGARLLVAGVVHLPHLAALARLG
jgi:Peptidase M50B-like